MTVGRTPRAGWRQPIISLVTFGSVVNVVAPAVHLRSASLQKRLPKAPLQQATGDRRVGGLQIRRDARVGDQPPIANEHHARHAEAVARFRDRRLERAQITRIPRNHLDRDGGARGRAEQADHDWRLPPGAIAIMAQLGERTRMPFEVTRRDVVEQERAVGQMSRGEFRFDAHLPRLHQIERRV